MIKSHQTWIRTLLIALALGGMVTLTACNTIEGAGKDIERTGERIQRAAE